MTSEKSGQGITVALVGLGSFGISFVPLFRDHPDVAKLVLCDPDQERLGRVSKAFGVPDVASDLAKVLANPEIDAVHLITPMQLHAKQAIDVLDAGKHCACAVPVGISLDEVADVVAAEERSGRNYMMMETAVYGATFRYVQDLAQSGDLGRVQFLRGAHYSDYEAWPSWKWYPPMAYATHVVAPVLMLAGQRALSVRCLGSGLMPEELAGPMANPFPIETAIYELEGGLAAEITRSAFRMARQVQEAFSVYGDRASFEWQQVESEEPVQFSYRNAEDSTQDFGQQRAAYAAHLGISAEALEELLPASRFPSVVAKRVDVNAASNPGQESQGGHAGAEALLVHEFVRSIVEGRPSDVGARVAAEWTAAGLCAHQSAVEGGATVSIPDYRAARPSHAE